MLDFLDLVEDLRRIPATAKAEVTKMAVKLGLDTYPEIHCLVRKAEKKWEIVAVALDPALLPPPTDGAVHCVAQLNRAKDPEQT